MTPEEKATLRKEALRRRDALPADERAAMSLRIFSEIMRLPAYTHPRVVLAYASFGSEPETRGFLRRVLEDGKRLLLPRVEPDGLALYAVRDLTLDLAPGPWGIPEPIADRCSLVDPGLVGLVLVPGVAFDRAGGRIGYGAGYYDRLLAGAVPGEAPLVAAAFEAQMVEQIPVDPHDVPVDVVITERGFYGPGTEGLA